MDMTESCNVMKAARNVVRLLLFAIIVSMAAGCSEVTVSNTAPSLSGEPAAVTVEAGETRLVSETTHLSSLTIGAGATVTAPEGNTLTLTVNGVETGQKLVDLLASDGATYLMPGTYQGNVVLTVAEENPTKSFKLRQALYLDESGVVGGKSVMAAANGKKPTAFEIEDIQISSTGECFNGIYVAGGEYTLKNININMIGDGRSDFEGYGAAITATGNDTRLVVADSRIENRGIVRTGVVAGGGSNVIVKDSVILTSDGDDPGQVLPQRGGSGLGGSIGLCRATVLLGTGTLASYINSTVTGTGWGLLAADECYDYKIVAVNTTVSHTGDIGGYGAYCIDGNGNAEEYFLGSEMNVGCTSVTLKGGHLFYGDSSRTAVSKLNADLDWRLTDQELQTIPEKNTVVNSKQFGVMCTSSKSTINVTGGTIFNTGDTVFLNKGKTLDVFVDGSQGAQLNPGNGVIYQLMDDDDAGMQGGAYVEPTEPEERDESFDVASTVNAATATFANITLEGNFYNSVGWGKNAAPKSEGGPGGGMGGPGGGDMASGGPAGAAGGGMPGGGPSGDAAEGGPPSGGVPSGTGGGMMTEGMMAMMAGMPAEDDAGKNMSLTFDNASITGVISSSEAHHAKSTLDYVDGVWIDYKLFGVVTNTANAPINNGVIVRLTNGSTWMVTGDSYLTRLTVEEGTTIASSKGYDVVMTVDGKAKPVGPGDYTGQIFLTLKKS